jgi:hypothetical protein
MNIEYIEIARITPATPENWLTNGETFGRVVNTQPENIEHWTEITDSEKVQMEEQMKVQIEEL